MHTPALLLIDGNNLAHFLYTNLVPGQKMTQADSLRLVKHLSSYARNNRDEVEIELCLDRSPGPLPQTPINLRIFSAVHPRTGDDLLLERFAFHHFSGRPCLVVSNDEAVLEDVQHSGGKTLKVTDFVRRAGTSKPVFRDFDDLPPLSLPFQQTENGHHEWAAIAPQNRSPRPAKNERKRKHSEPAPVDVAPLRQSTHDPSEEPAYPQPRDTAEDEPHHNPPHTEPAPASGSYYGLTIETWPLREGARFLRNAFCPQHRVVYQDLLEAVDPETATTRDLVDLAALLLKSCGDEPDFGKTGALMNRVRLALLKANGGTLSIGELAHQTEMKETGLRGRIKEKAGRWIRIEDTANGD